MSRIPVIATVAAAYRTVFGSYLRLLGISWASTVLLLGVTLGLLMPLIVRMDQEMLAGDPQGALAAVGPLFLFELIAFLLILVPVTGITRQVLGHPVTSPFFYFDIGGDYWRLVLAFVVLGLILIGVTLAVTIPVSIAVGIAAASSAGPNPDQAALAAQMRAYQPLIVIPVYAVMLFVFVRLGFLLPAIAIEEKRMGIGRNWRLTRGNSWRIVGMILLILVPLIVLGAIQLVAIALSGGPNYLDLFGTQAQSLKASADMIAIYQRYWYVYGVVGLLLYPLFYGPFLVASAYAYRAVVANAPAEQN